MNCETFRMQKQDGNVKGLLRNCVNVLKKSKKVYYGNILHTSKNAERDSVVLWSRQVDDAAMVDRGGYKNAYWAEDVHA